MTPEHALDVEPCGMEAFCDAHHLRRDDEEEDRMRIDESPDQPGADDAIDLGLAARNPEGSAFLVAPWTNGSSALPRGFKPAIKRFGTYALVPQPSGCTFAELLTALLRSACPAPAGSCEMSFAS